MKSLTLSENIKFSTTATVILTGVCVLISVFALTGIASAGNFDISVVETGGRRECSAMPPFSDTGSNYFTYTISVANNTNEEYRIALAAFHSDHAGCSAFDGAAGGGWDVISGKQNYLPGETGVTVLRYSVDRYDCGRVQYDASYRPKSKDISEATLFIGDVINYGEDCSYDPPAINNPYGFLDAVDCDLFGGWAKDADTTDAISVNIYLDGNYFKTLNSNSYRSDVGNYAFGYRWNTTDKLIINDGNTHTLKTVAINVGSGQNTELTSSPKTFGPCAIINPVPTCSINANPSTIQENQSSLLSWSSTNATSCTASNAWSGSKSTSGNQSVSPNTDSTYVLTCNGAGGTVTCSTVIDVTPVVIPTLSCSLSANPNSGTSPLNDVDLSATVAGTATGTINYKFDCRNDGSWDYVFDNVSDNPKTVTDACDYSSTGVYTANVRIERGTATPAYCQTTINVEQPSAVSCSINANPSTIQENQSSLLSWSSTNATSCTASNAWSVSKSTSGNQSVSPGSSSTYSLTCTGSSGTATCSTYVAVVNIIEPSCSITASPSSITNGNYSTLNWSSNNANYCYASNAWSGSKSVSGNQSVSPNTTSTYTLTCYNSNGRSETCATTVYVGTVYNNPNLSIEKLVRNVTNSNPSFYDSVSANLGDEVEFSIRINSVGTGTLTNVRVRDVLPSNMTYVSGSTTIDGSYRADGIANGWIFVGDISQGNSKEVKFKARISSTIAGVYGGSATINVANQNIQASSGVSITNLGRNITRNSNWSNSFQAYYGDEAEFSVEIKNNTSNSMTNVTVKETLPSNLSLIVNSTNVDGMNWGGDITGAGLNLGTLVPGQSKTIKFRTTVTERTSGSGGSVTLTNTAYANADNVAQLNDGASVIVGDGEVLGASTVATGVNMFGLVFLGIISCLIAIIVYCRLRENKLSEYLGKEKGSASLKYLIGLYFKTKLRIKLANLRFKQVYF